MARQDRKPQPRPVLPEKLRRAIEQKRSGAALRAPKPSPRSDPRRQGASRGPRG